MNPKNKISRGVKNSFRNGLTSSSEREKTSRKFYLYEDQIQALSESERSDSELLREILDHYLEVEKQ